MDAVRRAIVAGERTPAEIEALREAIRSVMITEGPPVRRRDDAGSLPRVR
ncbi:MAG: hypothetical protein ABFC89_07715 [Methanospirillum sp.]